MTESKLVPPGEPPVLASLCKQRSWSADSYRDEAWLRRKGNHERKKRSESVTDEDVDELKACIELGFGFDSPELDRKLSHTLPALGLFHAVHRQYSDSISKSSSEGSMSKYSSSASSTSESDASSPPGSPLPIFSPGDDPQMVKTRLKQWAQVVACSVLQSSY